MQRDGWTMVVTTISLTISTLALVLVALGHREMRLAGARQRLARGARR